MIFGSGGGFIIAVGGGAPAGAAGGGDAGGRDALISCFVKSQTKVKSNARRNVLEANAST